MPDFSCVLRHSNCLFVSTHCFFSRSRLQPRFHVFLSPFARSRFDTQQYTHVCRLFKSHLHRSVTSLTHSFYRSRDRLRLIFYLNIYPRSVNSVHCVRMLAHKYSWPKIVCLFCRLFLFGHLASRTFQEHFKNKCVTRLMCLFSHFVSGCQCDFQGCRLSIQIEQLIYIKTWKLRIQSKVILHLRYVMRAFKTKM